MNLDKVLRKAVILAASTLFAAGCGSGGGGDDDAGQEVFAVTDQCACDVGTDLLIQQDAGQPPDPGTAHDPGTGQDMGTGDDQGQVQDPGTPQDPGTQHDPGQPEDTAAPEDPGQPADPGQFQDAGSSAACNDDIECAKSEFCKKDGCDGKGVCTAMPIACTKEYAPVCGCDGKTYGNPCMAAAAGMNVAYAGECVTGICLGNGDCLPAEYCAKANCDGKGECVSKPEVCTKQYDPVCGCDGKTYSNACMAASAGMNVAYKGKCTTTGCSQNTDCDKVDYCFKEACDSALGVCKAMPEMCPMVWAPVCGCDGKTYGNSCEAAAAGVNVDPSGDCIIPLE